MTTHRISLLIDAQPERVFETFMDLGRMPEWVEGMTGVSDVTGPVDRPGTRYTVHFGPMASRRKSSRSNGLGMFEPASGTYS